MLAAAHEPIKYGFVIYLCSHVAWRVLFELNEQSKISVFASPDNFPTNIQPA